ncbi:signal peptidase II [Sporomusa sphaeroides]|uniref:Lipoprotein signal peptidase n=1 Tax=Sporomusa sphaeroides DSM 2875 TaxID=1337886 RepID=A0ABM9W3Z2_9FIRM|nr:signal peptidase II [Sporomusa sphaeroides]OLS58606.1 lipoprotein signal peptidase [Sporomusa sphaeroides DSM 2875]CVK19884.1 Lipoprotein signal peptidase [Sporomusa sphaeroides DSM 2875]
MPRVLLAAIAVAVVIIDQWSKHYIQSQMLPGMSIPVIENMFHITYVLNPGAAFGILENQRLFFIVIALVMLGLITYFFSHIPDNFRLMRLGVSLLASGALGNVIDRVQTGYVVDFFDFRIWPVFNVADIAIVTGVGCVIYTLVFIPFPAEYQEN